jgi:hypothetical protein
LLRAEVLQLEEIADKPPGRFSDYDAVWAGEPLQSSG